MQSPQSFLTLLKIFLRFAKALALSKDIIKSKFVIVFDVDL